MKIGFCLVLSVIFISGFEATILKDQLLDPVGITHIIENKRAVRAIKESNKPRRGQKKCCADVNLARKVEANNRQRNDQKKVEEKLVSEMQYSRPKKRQRSDNRGSGLSRLRAYGVFTDRGIHVSCTGCPPGWPNMLTVYPELEFGIPVSCSNCPANWPGALNLLGVGGDPSWAQNNDPPIYGDMGNAGSNFMTFNTGSNFGDVSGNGAVFPATDYGSDGFGNVDGPDTGLGPNGDVPEGIMGEESNTGIMDDDGGPTIATNS